MKNLFMVFKKKKYIKKGGVIMDVVNPEQARIAEEAGACAVMALERVPADIRKDGGVARMSDPKIIKAIKEAVTIPVMAKCRIGHFVEAQVCIIKKIIFFIRYKYKYLHNNKIKYINIIIVILIIIFNIDFRSYWY